MNEMNRIVKILVVVFFLCIVLTLNIKAQTTVTNKPSILFINVEWFTTPDEYVLDGKYLEDMKSQGYLIDLVKLRDLTKEKLYQYNVAVVMIPLDKFRPNMYDVYREKMPLLKEYLNDGGGVLYNDQRVSYDVDSMVLTNEFMSEYGLTGLAETIWDEANYFRQQNFMREYFITTTNIAKHTITTGIDKVIVALYGYETSTFKADDSWTILVNGENTAFSTTTYHPKPGIEIKPGTYSTNPPLFAIRQVGKGRLAYTGIGPFYTFHSGNHLIYEGIVLNEGNMFKLLKNTYDWLAAPSMQITSIGTFAGPSYSTPEPETIEYTDVRVFPVEHTIPQDTRAYFGLFGVHSNLTDGSSDVADYYVKAKELGYSFLVFTEPLAMMDEQKYNTLVEKCKEATDANFLALPGIEYYDIHWGGEQNRYIVTYMSKWMKEDWLTPDKKNISPMVGTGGVLMGYIYPLIGVVTPHLNPMRLDYLKFYNMIATHSYEDGKLIDDSVDLYLERVKNFYEKAPLVYHKIMSPSEIPPFGETFVTGVWAASLASFETQNKDIDWGHDRGLHQGSRAFVTNGPRINYYRLIRPSQRDYLVLREQQWKYYYDAESDNPIVEIQLWDGTSPFRILKVDNEKHVSGSFTGFQEKQHYLTLRVIDNEGKMAISGPTSIMGRRHFLNMCIDLQNDFDAGVQVAKNGLLDSIWIVGGFIMGSAQIGPRLNVPSVELFPVGRDAYSGGISGILGYSISTTGGLEQGYGYIDHYFASEECTISDRQSNFTLLPGSVYSSSKFANAKSRYYSFTPNIYGWNLLLIEDEIEILKDVELSAGDIPSPKLEGLHYTLGDSNTFDFYAYNNGMGDANAGRWREGGKALVEAPLTNMVIAPGGYVGTYPDFYGCIVVYPLEKEVEVSLRNATSMLALGFGKGGEKLKKGDKFNFKFLAGLKWQTNGQEDFEMLSKVYNLDGKKPSYDVQITNGKVLSTVYALSLEAGDYNAQCTITKNPEMPTDLPLILKGINERWNVSLYDYEKGTIKRVGAIDGTAYSVIDITNSNRNIFFGNSLTCDNNEVWLELMKVEGQEPGEDKTAVIEVYNPTDAPLTVTLTSPLFAFTEDVDIDSKTIKVIEVPLPDWKDKRITIYTNELTNQVKKFILGNN